MNLKGVFFWITVAICGRRQLTNHLRAATTVAPLSSHGSPQFAAEPRQPFRLTETGAYQAHQPSANRSPIEVTRQ